MTYLPTTTASGLEVAEKKIDSLLALKKITPKDIEHLSPLECNYLSERLTTLLEKLKGEERDDLLDKIDQILPADAKNSSWERNHKLINNAISHLMRQYGSMPSKNAIAAETGLSRQTIAKHLKEYKQHPEFTDQTEQFKFMTHDILANVFKFANQGDMRAARLYFEMVGAISKQRSGGTTINEQNNHIQINNILSQENLKQLTAEQLNQIEKIVTGKELRRI